MLLSRSLYHYVMGMSRDVEDHEEGSCREDLREEAPRKPGSEDSKHWPRPEGKLAPESCS